MRLELSAAGEVHLLPRQVRVCVWSAVWRTDRLGWGRCVLCLL